MSQSLRNVRLPSSMTRTYFFLFKHKFLLKSKKLKFFNQLPFFSDENDETADAEKDEEAAPTKDDDEVEKIMDDIFGGDSDEDGRPNQGVCLIFVVVKK